MKLASLCLACLSVPLNAQPISHREACAKFSSAIVSIDGGGESRGSGFIVSADGLILTASHVVKDEAGSYYSAIVVSLPHGKTALAKPTPISVESVGQDYALLKVDTTEKLPFLELGSVVDAQVGGDATIIGFPFSSLTREGKPITAKFCLSATFAAITTETVQVNSTTRTRQGYIPVQNNVQLNVVYFQGPSVKGLSGSPIISRDTGEVVGIVSTKLSGISNSLETLEKATARGLGGSVWIGGLNPGEAVHEIVTVMDNQLANGMGSATGIDEPKEALRKEQNKKK